MGAKGHTSTQKESKHVKQASIRIAADGLCFYASSTPEKNKLKSNATPELLTYTKSYSALEKSWTERVKNACLELPTFTSEDCHYRVYLDYAAAMLMPSALLSTELEEAFKTSAFFLSSPFKEAREQLLQRLDPLSAYSILFQIPKALRVFLQRAFPSLSITHTQTLCIQDALQASSSATVATLSAVATGNQLSVCILKDGELRLSNAYPYTTAEDLKYRLTQLIQLLALNPKRDSLRIYTPAQAYPELQKYLQERVRDVDYFNAEDDLPLFFQQTFHP